MYGQGRCVTQDDKEAVKWYRKAAEQGDHPAQVNLGLSYQSGVGVEKNQLEAYKWLRLVNSQYWEADNWTCGILGSLSNFVLGFDLTAAQKKKPTNG